MNIENKFVVTEGCARIWAHMDMPEAAYSLLCSAAKWRGYDKREGARISFEIPKALLGQTIEELESFGMVREDTQVTMNALVGAS
jgi:hypothetical protein